MTTGTVKWFFCLARRPAPVKPMYVPQQLSERKGLFSDRRIPRYGDASARPM
jgi:hypothetical protein